MTGIFFLAVVTLCVAVDAAQLWGGADPDPGRIVGDMEAAYGRVEDYRALLVIRGFGGDDSFRGTQTLQYMFKKPNRIRLDFESPHRGMVVIFPDPGGKVSIRPPVIGGMFRFRLDPRSELLEISPGQQICDSDLGVLIRNIGHTVTDMFLGDLEVVEEPGVVRIRVLADNPFRRGVPTRYEFTIDRRLSLPVAVSESTVDNVLLRTVSYRNLRVNPGIPESAFSVE